MYFSTRLYRDGCNFEFRTPTLVKQFNKGKPNEQSKIAISLPLPNYAEIIHETSTIVCPKKIFNRTRKMQMAQLKKVFLRKMTTQDGRPIQILPSIGALALNLKTECTVLGEQGSLTFRCISAVWAQDRTVLSAKSYCKWLLDPFPQLSRQISLKLDLTLRLAETLLKLNEYRLYQDELGFILESCTEFMNFLHCFILDLVT